MASGIEGINGGGIAWPAPTIQHDRIGASGDAPFGTQGIGGGTQAPSFGKVLTQFVEGVNETQEAAAAESRKVLLGESTNIHQAMLAGEESKLAMTLLVEVRNKLVEGFQEVMRMQV